MCRILTITSKARCSVAVLVPVSCSAFTTIRVSCRRAKASLVSVMSLSTTRQMDHSQTTDYLARSTGVPFTAVSSFTEYKIRINHIQVPHDCLHCITVTFIRSDTLIHILSFIASRLLSCFFHIIAGCIICVRLRLSAKRA